MRHLDEMAKEVIVFEFELLCLRKLRVAGLQRRDYAAALVAQRPESVEARIKPGTDEAAVLARKRQSFGERLLQAQLK